ncbi:hypothetical protein HOD19_00515 [bacterium]|jgi:hypothetical protein|nr:hypothetical protein [bacterium]MBT4649449.1 hypothetical protein [bacterium]
MKKISLQAEQIMTTNDFPVHNEQVLKIYFKIAKANPELLPVTPVIHKSLGLSVLGEKVQNFFEKNSELEYIMCDGSHKTTALTLTDNPINAMLLESDNDIKEFKALIDSGEIFSFACSDSIKEILKDKAEHFAEAEFFQTVKSKTDRMVDEKVIPQYMIDFYKKIKLT